MTIQTAIEKAVEGGWKLKGYEQYPQEVEFLPAEKDGEKITKWNPYWVNILVTTTYIDGKPFKNIKQERIEYVVSSPLFWQSLGKSMGWGEICECGWRSSQNFVHYDAVGRHRTSSEVRYRWHNLLDHLAEGGSIESYFETL